MAQAVHCRSNAPPARGLLGLRKSSDSVIALMLSEGLFVLNQAGVSAVLLLLQQLNFFLELDEPVFMVFHNLRFCGMDTGKQVELENKVEKDLLGGVKLRYDGTQVDDTVRRHLDAVRTMLQNTML